MFGDWFLTRNKRFFQLNTFNAHMLIGFCHTGTIPLHLAMVVCGFIQCNMVEWAWWNRILITSTNCPPSVLSYYRLGHPSCKNVPKMTYHVLSKTLSLYSLMHSVCYCVF